MTKITGRVKWYNTKKGYGFVQRDDGQKDVFIHASQVKAAGLRFLAEEQAVSFDIEEGPKGPNAINLEKLKPKFLMNFAESFNFKGSNNQNLFKKLN